MGGPAGAEGPAPGFDYYAAVPRSPIPVPRPSLTAPRPALAR